MIDFDSIHESNHYSLDRLPGQGSLGNIYKGNGEGYNKPLAFKTIWQANAEVPKFLLREYEILRMLDHPNIIQVYDLFKLNGRAYFAMEYFNGVSVDRALGSPLPNSPQAEVSVRALPTA